MSCNRVIRRLIPLLLLLALPTAEAKPRKPRFGFQHFTARYTGGYSIATATGTQAGPAKIRIRAATTGRSAKVDWSNTFYTSGGSYQVTLHWTFNLDGTVSATTIDPNQANFPAIGAFELNGNHPVKFTATDATGTVMATGQLRLIGGGALGITVTLTGLPDGDVTYGFSGSRVR